jgi:predicted phosphodiesterase
MAVQVLSDLHLEAPKAYDVFEIVPKAPYLALLGDIGNIESHKDNCLGFLTRQLIQFRIVFFVPGNHEAYHSNWPTTLRILGTFEQDVRNNSALGEFIVLDRVAFRLPDCNTVVLGCSLFSSIPPDSHTAVSLGLNDFFYISDWDVDMHNESHKRDLAWLNTEVGNLEQSDVNIIIFSHWSPSKDVRAIDPRHVGSQITSAFLTDLSSEVCFKSGKVKIWAFGHTHYNCDFAVERNGVGSLRLLANQRGYYFAQAEGYSSEKILEV